MVYFRFRIKYVAVYKLYHLKNEKLTSFPVKQEALRSHRILKIVIDLFNTSCHFNFLFQKLKACRKETRGSSRVTCEQDLYLIRKANYQIPSLQKYNVFIYLLYRNKIVISIIVIRIIIGCSV